MFPSYSKRTPHIMLFHNPKSKVLGEHGGGLCLKDNVRSLKKYKKSTQ